MSEVRVLHISDLHFGAEDPDKVEAVLADCAEFAPHLVCVTGDVVNTPFWPGNFSKARDFVRELANRVDGSSGPENILIVPGNHDAYLGLRPFKSGLRQRQVDFCRSFVVEGRNVLTFGFDSTTFALRDLRNSGMVSERKISDFLEEVARQRTGLTHAGYANALKIAMIHHHPLPTMKSELEGMLYLKNAGRFMSAMVSAKVDLILHGHQHDPCDATITYGGGLERVLVLSAGTATKQRTDESPLSKRTQYHRIHCSRSSIQVEARHYVAERKIFLPGKALRNEVGGGSYALRTREINYAIGPGGELRESTRELLRCKVGRSENAYRVYFGVDQESRECAFDDLGFEIKRGGLPLEAKHWTVTLDNGREKVIDVSYDSLVSSDSDTTIEWSYRWPGGWAKLAARGDDESSYLPSGLDELRMTIRNEDPTIRIVAYEVHTLAMDHLRPFRNFADQEVGFAISAPPPACFINSIIRVKKVGTSSN